MTTRGGEGVSEVGSTNAQATWEIVPGWMWWESCVPYIEMGVVPRRDGRVADTVPYNAMYGIHGEVGETLYHT